MGRTPTPNFSGSTPGDSIANIKLTLTNSASERTLFSHKADEGPVVVIPCWIVVAVIFSYKTTDGVYILAKSCTIIRNKSIERVPFELSQKKLSFLSRRKVVKT